MRIVKIKLTAAFSDANNEPIEEVGYPGDNSVYIFSRSLVKVRPLEENTYKYYLVRVYISDDHPDTYFVWGIRGGLLYRGRKSTVLYEEKGSWATSDDATRKAHSVIKDLIGHKGYMDVDEYYWPKIPWFDIGGIDGSKSFDKKRSVIKPVEQIKETTTTTTLPPNIEQVEEDDMSDFADLLGRNKSWYKKATKE